MDPRRSRTRREQLASGHASPVATISAGVSDNTAILAKLDVLIAEQHELRRLVHKLAVPVDVLLSRDAAKRIGVSLRTLEGLTSTGLFSDARAPERRGRGSPRTYFTDELDVYRTDGEVGVKRLRRELGRD